MKEKLDSLLNEEKEKLLSVTDENGINNIKSEYLGKKSELTNIMSKMREYSDEEKKEVGRLTNEFRNGINSLLDEKMEAIKNAVLKKKLESETIDITLDGYDIPVGSPNILEGLIENMEDFFMSMGYDVVEGPELEQDLYNFELLNLPKGHPARDAQDTFYTKGETLLLRSQTSPVQMRTMLSMEEKKPLRMICPGKTYRRDDDDATHSHQFTQMEGLLIDKNISLRDLKGTFDVMAKKIFGDDVVTRFRPSYYPFTEPSVELDVSCFKCAGKGCPICKGTGWITVGGAGVVHPKVLENGGYDPNVWSGFAFGMGVERLAMLKYGISDIRTFYLTDLRIGKDFDRRDA